MATEEDEKSLLPNSSKKLLLVLREKRSRVVLKMVLASLGILGIALFCYGASDGFAVKGPGNPEPFQPPPTHTPSSRQNPRIPIDTPLGPLPNPPTTITKTPPPPQPPSSYSSQQHAQGSCGTGDGTSSGPRLRVLDSRPRDVFLCAPGPQRSAGDGGAGAGVDGGDGGSADAEGRAAHATAPGQSWLRYPSCIEQCSYPLPAPSPPPASASSALSSPSSSSSSSSPPSPAFSASAIHGNDRSGDGDHDGGDAADGAVGAITRRMKMMMMMLKVAGGGGQHLPLPVPSGSGPRPYPDSSSSGSPSVPPHPFPSSPPAMVCPLPALRDCWLAEQVGIPSPIDYDDVTRGDCRYVRAGVTLTESDYKLCFHGNRTANVSQVCGLPGGAPPCRLQLSQATLHCSRPVHPLLGLFCAVLDLSDLAPEDRVGVQELIIAVLRTSSSPSSQGQPHMVPTFLGPLLQAMNLPHPPTSPPSSSVPLPQNSEGGEDGQNGAGKTTSKPSEPDHDDLEIAIKVRRRRHGQRSRRQAASAAGPQNTPQGPPGGRQAWAGSRVMMTLGANNNTSSSSSTKNDIINNNNGRKGGVDRKGNRTGPSSLLPPEVVQLIGILGSLAMGATRNNNGSGNNRAFFPNSRNGANKVNTASATVVAKGSTTAPPPTKPPNSSPQQKQSGHLVDKTPAATRPDPFSFLPPSLLMPSQREDQSGGQMNKAGETNGQMGKVGQVIANRPGADRPIVPYPPFMSADHSSQTNRHMNKDSDNNGHKEKPNQVMDGALFSPIMPTETGDQTSGQMNLGAQMGGHTERGDHKKGETERGKENGPVNIAIPLKGKQPGAFMNDDVMTPSGGEGHREVTEVIATLQTVAELFSPRHAHRYTPPPHPLSPSTRPSQPLRRSTRSQNSEPLQNSKAADHAGLSQVSDSSSHGKDPKHMAQNPGTGEKKPTPGISGSVGVGSTSPTTTTTSTTTSSGEKSSSSQSPPEMHNTNHSGKFSSSFSPPRSTPAPTTRTSQRKPSASQRGRQRVQSLVDGLTDLFRFMTQLVQGPSSSSHAHGGSRQHQGHLIPSGSGPGSGSAATNRKDKERPQHQPKHQFFARQQQKAGGLSSSDFPVKAGNSRDGEPARAYGSSKTGDSPARAPGSSKLANGGPQLLHSGGHTGEAEDHEDVDVEISLMIQEEEPRKMKVGGSEVIMESEDVEARLQLSSQDFQEAMAPEVMQAQQFMSSFFPRPRRPHPPPQPPASSPIDAPRLHQPPPPPPAQLGMPRPWEIDPTFTRHLHSQGDNFKDSAQTQDKGDQPPHTIPQPPQFPPRPPSEQPAMIRMSPVLRDPLVLLVSKDNEEEGKVKLKPDVAANAHSRRKGDPDLGSSQTEGEEPGIVEIIGMSREQNPQFSASFPVRSEPSNPNPKSHIRRKGDPGVGNKPIESSRTRFRNPMVMTFHEAAEDSSNPDSHRQGDLGYVSVEYLDDDDEEDFDDEDDDYDETAGYRMRPFNHPPPTLVSAASRFDNGPVFGANPPMQRDRQEVIELGVQTSAPGMTPEARERDVGQGRVVMSQDAAQSQHQHEPPSQGDSKLAARGEDLASSSQQRASTQKEMDEAEAAANSIHWTIRKRPGISLEQEMAGGRMMDRPPLSWRPPPHDNVDDNTSPDQQQQRDPQAPSFGDIQGRVFYDSNPNSGGLLEALRDGPTQPAVEVLEPRRGEDPGRLPPPPEAVHQQETGKAESGQLQFRARPATHIVDPNQPPLPELQQHGQDKDGYDAAEHQSASLHQGTASKRLNPASEMTNVPPTTSDPHLEMPPSVPSRTNVVAQTFSDNTRGQQQMTASSDKAAIMSSAMNMPLFDENHGESKYMSFTGPNDAKSLPLSAQDKVNIPGTFSSDKNNPNIDVSSPESEYVNMPPPSAGSSNREQTLQTGLDDNIGMVVLQKEAMADLPQKQPFGGRDPDAMPHNTEDSLLENQAKNVQLSAPTQDKDSPAEAQSMGPDSLLAPPPPQIQSQPPTAMEMVMASYNGAPSTITKHVQQQIEATMRKEGNDANNRDGATGEVEAGERNMNTWDDASVREGAVRSPLGGSSSRGQGQGMTLMTEQRPEMESVKTSLNAGLGGAQEGSRQPRHLLLKKREAAALHPHHHHTHIGHGLQKEE